MYRDPLAGPIVPGCPVTVQAGRCGCQGFFRVGRSVDRSLILFAIKSAILLAMVAMTSSSFRAYFTHCIISSSAADFLTAGRHR